MQEDLDKGDGSGYRHSCYECKESLPASKLLLLDIEDWAGSLTDVSYACSLQTKDFFGPPKEFSKAVRGKWNARKSMLGHNVACNSDMNWNLIQKLSRTSTRATTRRPTAP